MSQLFPNPSFRPWSVSSSSTYPSPTRHPGSHRALPDPRAAADLVRHLRSPWRHGPWEAPKGMAFHGFLGKFCYWGEAAKIGDSPARLQRLSSNNPTSKAGLRENRNCKDVGVYHCLFWWCMFGLEVILEMWFLYNLHLWLAQLAQNRCCRGSLIEGSSL